MAITPVYDGEYLRGYLQDYKISCNPTIEEKTIFLGSDWEKTITYDSYSKDFSLFMGRIGDCQSITWCKPRIAIIKSEPLSQVYIYKFPISSMRTTLKDFSFEIEEKIPFEVIQGSKLCFNRVYFPQKGYITSFEHKDGKTHFTIRFFQEPVEIDDIEAPFTIIEIELYLSRYFPVSSLYLTGTEFIKLKRVYNPRIITLTLQENRKAYLFHSDGVLFAELQQQIEDENATDPNSFVFHVPRASLVNMPQGQGTRSILEYIEPYVIVPLGSTKEEVIASLRNTYSAIDK